MMSSPQPALRSPKVPRSFARPNPEPYVVQIHDHDCGCPACEPYVPSCPARLDAIALGKLATAGAAVGTAIAFLIDPAGAAAALLATIGL